MANTKSAKKMVRKIARRTEVNRHRRSQVRTMVRITEEAIEEGDVATATATLKKVEPHLHRASTKGILHKRTASRKVSRLTKRLAALTKSDVAAAPPAAAPPAAPLAAAADEAPS